MGIPFSIVADYSMLWAVYLLVVAFILGACFGSFINCMAWRIAHDECWYRGRSHCATCNHPLGILDLIPVFSWLFLRGKCRYCGERISPRYMVTELLLGVVFVLIVWKYGVSIEAASLLVLSCILLGLSLVDLETFIIPNGFIIVGIIVWVLTFWTFPVPTHSIVVGTLFQGLFQYDWMAVLAEGLLSGVVVAGVMLLLSLVFDKVVGRRSLGGGDVKLLFVVGLYLGLYLSIFNLILACIIGIVFGMVFKHRAAADEGDGEGKTGAFPFGPAISAATLITLLMGSSAVGAYLALF